MEINKLEKNLKKNKVMKLISFQKQMMNKSNLKNKSHLPKIK